MHRAIKPLAVLAAIATATTSMAAGTGDGVHDHRAHAHKAAAATLDSGAPTERLSDVACVDGEAGPFECDGVDLLSFVPYAEVQGAVNTARAQSHPQLVLSEAWGWVDPQTSNEYALVGKADAVAIWNITDPTDPVHVANVINHSVHQETWYDIKVMGDWALITSESTGLGMQVFDLTRLRGLEAPVDLLPDALYAPNLAAHNVVVNEDSQYAYLVGSGTIASYLAWSFAGYDPELCNGGLHMVDLSNPTLPTFAGCFGDDGYTHDAECITYDGPDADHVGREICAAYNEDTVTIIDVTDKMAPFEISRVTYPDPEYTHQGWFTDDRSYIIFNDELDEQRQGMNTRTMIADVSDLDNPVFVGAHEHRTTAVDHNLYVHDDLVWQANYTVGLQVLEMTDLAAAELTRVAWFDTFPMHDYPTFEGTWSAYPFLPSGTIIVSGGSAGLFLLRMQDAATA